MTLFVFATLMPITQAQTQSDGQDRVPEALQTSGAQECLGANGILPVFPDEVSHVYGVRLAVGGNSRFEVQSLVYSLIDQLGIPLCNGARPHRLDVWVQSTEVPDPVPALQFSTVFIPTPSGGPNDFYEIDIPDFVVEPTEQVFVGFEMTADAQDDALCVLTCGQSVAPPTGGEHFWSNAATPPYAWSDVVTDFGILSTPLVTLNGERLLIDPTASVGEGVSLGEGVVVGVGSVVGDRSAVGDGAVLLADVRLGRDATVGAGATLGERTVVRDRTDVGADATLGQDVTVSHDVGIGAGAQVGHGSVVRDRVQIGADVRVEQGVTIGYDVVIGAGAHIGAGSVLGDRAVVGEGAVLGTNVRVAIDATVAAGAVVASDTVVSR